MADLTIKERLEVKRLRQIALKGQINADHKAKIKEINAGRAAAGLRPLGV